MSSPHPPDLHRHHFPGGLTYGVSNPSVREGAQNILRHVTSTYEASSHLGMWRQPGNVTISTFTRTETTRDALELMLCELECVACERLTEEKVRKDSRGR